MSNKITRNILHRTLTNLNRAIVYTHHGNPTQVLHSVSFPPLPPPPPNSVNLRILFSPINPADINVIQGVYPVNLNQRSDLQHLGLPVFVPGNEALAQVYQLGDAVSDLRNGDRVIIAKPHSGTWSSAINLPQDDLIKVPLTLSDLHAATISVNPPTAWNLLHNYVQLKQGDWIVQNGANSAVGQAVIQICKHLNLNSINFIRNRKDVDSLKSKLTTLGATHVLTYDDLEDKSTRGKVKSWTGDADIRLALNCVSGPSTTKMLGLLGHDAHLVSYGAMSKLPLSIPTSYFFFKNLTCHGFLQNKWYKDHGRAAREELMCKLAALMTSGHLKEPEHEIVSFSSSQSNETVTERIRQVLETIEKGQYGKKVLLKFEGSA